MEDSFKILGMAIGTIIDVILKMKKKGWCGMTGLAILEKVVKVISVGLAVVEVVSECKKILDQTKS